VSRVLTMVERRVARDDRSAYLAGVHARAERATARAAHFWVFEQDGEPGRFVEFTEAADPAAIADTHDGTVPAPVWRAVEGV
jgi:hypothetical protein